MKVSIWLTNAENVVKHGSEPHCYASSETCDMSKQGWVLVLEYDVEVPIPEKGELLRAASQSLVQMRAALDAAHTTALTDLDRRANELLSIGYES